MKRATLPHVDYGPHTHWHNQRMGSILLIVFGIFIFILGVLILFQILQVIFAFVFAVALFIIVVGGAFLILRKIFYE